MAWNRRLRWGRGNKEAGGREYSGENEIARPENAAMLLGQIFH